MTPMPKDRDELARLLRDCWGNWVAPAYDDTAAELDGWRAIADQVHTWVREAKE